MDRFFEEEKITQAGFASTLTSHGTTSTLANANVWEKSEKAPFIGRFF